MVAGPWLLDEPVFGGNEGGAIVWNPLEWGGFSSCCDCVLQPNPLLAKSTFGQPIWSPNLAQSIFGQY